MIDKLSLNSLKFFYYVASFGSVTLASQRLFVTQSAVSKQIKKLEADLGIVLFDRVNKSVVLTAEGKQLFTCCEQVFGQLESCLNQLKSSATPSGSLVLTCEPTIAMKWLIPRLAAFNALGHEFDIVLLTAGGAVDFHQHNIDMALRRNDFAWGEHIFSQKISDEFMLIVQSPHYQATDTAQEKIFLSSSRPNLWRQLKQQLYFSEASSTIDKVYLEHFYLCIEAVLAGLGKSVLSVFMVENALKTGALIAKSPVIADGSAYYLLSATSFQQDSRKVIFTEWLQKEMQATKLGINKLIV